MHAKAVGRWRRKLHKNQSETPGRDSWPFWHQLRIDVDVQHITLTFGSGFKSICSVTLLCSNFRVGRDGEEASGERGVSMEGKDDAGKAFLDVEMDGEFPAPDSVIASSTTIGARLYKVPPACE